MILFIFKYSLGRAADGNFDCSVTVDGDTAVIEAMYDDDKGTNSGSAYVFTAAVPTGVNDIDDDLIFDLHDNCPHIYNPDQQDSNADGKGDACCPAAATGGVNLAPVYMLLLKR